jgi:hypothetical protein
MTAAVYTRSYLHGIPTQGNITETNEIVNLFINQLTNVASLGRTSYFFDMSYMKYVPPEEQGKPRKWALFRQQKVTYSIPMEEIIQLVKEKFPDSSVTYREQWVTNDLSARIHRKGIIIDWA